MTPEKELTPEEAIHYEKVAACLAALNQALAAALKIGLRIKIGGFAQPELERPRYLGRIFNLDRGEEECFIARPHEEAWLRANNGITGDSLTPAGKDWLKNRRQRHNNGQHKG